VIQSKNGKTPLPTEDEVKEAMASEREAWLNKIMSMILPQRVFERASQTSTQGYVKKWMQQNGITIATQGEKMAVLRDGKVYATWEPGQKKVDDE
jgi:hypothetical protein